MYTKYSNQRETYKVLESLMAKKHEDVMTFLKSVVEDIVSHHDFDVNGGRVWVLDKENYSYTIAHQYGNVKEIPDGFSVDVNDFPYLADLKDKRSSLQYETNSLLKSKGIQLYSVTGVGELIEFEDNYLYQYLIGFNAPEIKQTFFETLNIISSLATITIRNLSNQAARQKIEKDIYKASEIQRSLLPISQKKYHDFDIYGVCQPTSYVGGDYFDYIQSLDDDDDTLGVLVYDAASHGLPAAIQALFVSGAIKMGLTYSTRISKFMSRLNTLIFDTFPYERFVTLFYCQLSLSANRLVLYANAGHCPAIHYRPALDTFKQLNPTGGLLGLMQQQKFGVENIRMHPGDVLMLYTDGISEAKNSKMNFFGEERIHKLIKKYAHLDSKTIVENIIQEVNKFSDDSDYLDDRTIIVIKRDCQ